MNFLNPNLTSFWLDCVVLDLLRIGEGMGEEGQQLFLPFGGPYPPLLRKALPSMNGAKSAYMQGDAV